MKFNLAIELGGVNTCIYRRNQGLVLKEPSLICASCVGDQYEIKAIGFDAEKLQGKTNDTTYIFSPISGGEVKSVEYATEMLKEYLGKVELKKFPKENAIFLTPAGISEESKEDLKKVGKLCGLGKVEVVPSVIFSAYTSNLPMEVGKTILAVHMGGSLTDVATINMNSILKGSSVELGGRFLDVEIAENVAKKHKIEISVATAKKIKEEISTLIEGDIRTTQIVGIDENSGKPKKTTISSEEIYPILNNFINELVVAIETTINLCPPDVSSDITADGIFVTGGLTKIPGLGKFLEKKLQMKVNVVKDGELAPIMMAGKLLSDSSLIEEIIENF
ncbi:MAG: rod shape-determining protein [Firmicutes bacterium]|nr:rod shape-determining protein [Bacillota bacterium]MDY3659023.1 rod shape-determining protein [Eubacteriales bacterium]